MKPVDAREAALDVLVRVERGAASDRALDGTLRRRRLEPRDRGLATEIVYGVLRRRATLDALIAPLSKRPLDALDDVVLVGLRVAVYQLAYLDNIPEHAAVDTSVEAVKRRRPQAAGFVNGVLRSFLRSRAAGAAETAAPDWPERLDVPDWWAERWRRRYGDAASEDWFAATLRPAPFVLRRHRRVVEEVALVAALEAAGVAVADTGHSAGSLVVTDGNPIGTEPLAAGWFSLRSDASQLVTSLVPATGTGLVLDACAGRGGKAVQIAEDTDAPLVVAHDLARWRLDACREAAGTAGVDRVRCVQGDMADPGLRRRFSTVLVDAPCSGLGTVRRRPELKWRNDPARLARLADLQRRILSGAAGVLADDGLLLYVTCSTEPEENEEVVAAVVAASPDLVAASIEAPHAAPFVADDGYFRTYPGHPELDGFSAAAIRRRRS